ncbi:MAG: 2TM domain-containing protein [Cyanobacteria bacterium P01_H01_bin.119]
MTELYASEEAQQILQIAIAKETEAGELSRSQLLDIASELGISGETLQAAEQEWLIRKDELKEQAIFNQYRRQRFQHHLIRYFVVNGFLFLIDLLLGGGVQFSLFIMLIWGLVIALHAWQTFWPSHFRYDEEFQKWRRNRQIRRSFSNFVNRLLGT